MKTRLGMLFAGVVAMTAVSAQAGILYTVRTADRMLQKFDTQTLTLTDVGILTPGFDFGDLGYDPTTQTMYMVQGYAGTNLYTVDLNNAATTLVGNTGDGTLFSLVWDPNTNTMYTGESTLGSNLYSIDLGSWALSTIGNTSIYMDGLTWDSTRNQMVAAYAGPGDLYTVDPTDASVTLIYDGDFFNNCGIAYDSDTDLYWMVDWSGNMYTFDPNNGYARNTVMNLGSSYDGLCAATSGGGGQYNLRLSGQCPGTLTVSWANATPQAQQAIVFGNNQGNTTIPNGKPCAGTTLGVAGGVMQVGNYIPTGNGSGHVNGNAGSFACGHYLQLVEGGSCNTSNVAQIP